MSTSTSTSWEEKVACALHYCIEGRILILTAQSLNPVAHKQLTSTITNLSQSNIRLALDLSLPENVHEYIVNSSANIRTQKAYDLEVALVSEFLADYDDIMEKPHTLDAVLPVLRNTASSLTFSDTPFDPAREEVPYSPVSRANISNFVCTQINLSSGSILRSLGYTPDLQFSETERAQFLPAHFSPRTGIGQHAGH